MRKLRVIRYSLSFLYLLSQTFTVREKVKPIILFTTRSATKSDRSGSMFFNWCIFMLKDAIVFMK